MGCGAFSRSNQPVVYVNQANPPEHVLVRDDTQLPAAYPPSGIVQQEEVVYFDDREHVKQCQVVHINSITILTQDYIIGIDVLYYLDGMHAVKQHAGQKQGRKTKLSFQPTEHIYQIKVTHDSSYIHSIEITTNYQTFEVEGSSGKGPQVQTVNLKDQRRAIVAFKGRHDKYLRALSVYSWALAGNQSLSRQFKYEAKKLVSWKVILSGAD